MTEPDRELSRLRWRCRRGMLENDLILSRFLDKEGDSLAAQDLAALKILLDYPDNELWELLAGRNTPADNQLKLLLDRIRSR